MRTTRSARSPSPGTDVYAGGDFTSVGATTRNRLARLEPDGTLDTGWNPDAERHGQRPHRLRQRRLRRRHVHDRRRGEPRPDRQAVDRATASPTRPGTRGPARTVSALAVSGTTVYAGGLFLTIDGTVAQPPGEAHRRRRRPRQRRGRPRAPARRSTRSRCRAAHLFVGGAFTTINGSPRNRIAKLDAGGTGTVDAGWDPDASSTVTSLATAGTDLYAGGFFTTIGAEPRNFVAAVDTGTGVVDPDWDPDANNIVRALALTATDVYVGGDFTEISRSRTTGWRRCRRAGDGEADAGWDPDVANGSVLSLATPASGSPPAGRSPWSTTRASRASRSSSCRCSRRTRAASSSASRTSTTGETATQTSTITNPGAATITFSAVTLGGADASQFVRLTGNPDDCTATTVLDQNETCTVRARFDPTTVGPKSAEVRRRL